MAEILATLDDINAELPSDDDTPVVVADEDNTALIQIAVSRVVRGYLSRVIDNTVLAQWVVPDKTPEIVNVIAGKLIAAQLHFNKIAETTGLIDQNSFSQKRYDEAMAMLNDIINGTIILPNIVTISTESITSADFFPIDAKDRAFTLSQPF